MDEVSFGEWLRRHRNGRGLTREQLAHQIGCAVVTLRKIEAEERRPSVQMVERLAEIFNIPKNERTSFLRYARGDWKHAPADASEESPWHAETKSRRSNIPASTTSLIAREGEIALVREYMSKRDIRLVTLVGPPGIGKTRLSIESARAVLSDFPDGVFFVALAPLNDPSLIAPTIAQTLGFLESKNLTAQIQLSKNIRDKRMLLVLDNCEHLIEDVAALVSSLLAACSRLKILATSRESLRILGEWLYAVPALDFPEENSSVNFESTSEFPALSLFAERARAVRSDFILTTENIKTISTICAHLDGLPLAIELIAARLRLMSPQALLERLNDQFILSADGMRAASERQKTLNNAIAWSYNLLSDEEQKLFSYLSVFSGGFTLEAAETIFSEMFTGRPVSDLITLLSDKNLLQRVFQTRGEIRFNMLVTIQQFALDILRRMGNETNGRNRHLAYFRGLAEQAKPHLHSAQQLVWLDRLESEHANIRAALNWAQESGSITAGLRLATDLEWFWIWRAYLREPCLALENLLAQARPVDQTPVLARGHHVVGFLEWLLGNNTVGPIHAQESERLCLLLGPASKTDLADARLLLLFFTDLAFANPMQIRQMYEEILKLFQEAGDQWKMAYTIFCMGLDLRHSGDLMGARQACEQSLRLFRECGDNIGASEPNRVLAFIAFEKGEYEESRTRYEEILHFYRQARLNLWMDIPLWMLGVIAVREGNYAHAKDWYSECLLFDQQMGLNSQLAECLIGFAGIANAERRLERAAQLVGAAEREVEVKPWQMPLENIDQIELQRLTTVLRGKIGDAMFEALAAEGRAMTTEQAVAYALEK